MAALSTAPLQFEEFCRLLRHNGFVVGVDQYVRVHQLYARLEPEVSPAELRTLLCPLFAKSPEQQRAFYEIFDALYLVPHAGGEQTEGEEADRIPAPPRWRWIAATAAGLLLAGVLWWWLLWPAPAKAPLEEPPAPAPPAALPEPAQSAAEPLRVVRAAVVEGAIPQPWYLVYRLPAAWAILLAPLILFGVFEWHRRRARLFALKQIDARLSPPFSWPLRLPRLTGLRLFESEGFHLVARRLRQRTAGVSRQLDVPETLKATSRRLGFLAPRYRLTTSPPEYLVLIRRRTGRDLLAAWYFELIQALAREQLYCEVFFFQEDGRIQESASTGKTVPLEALARRYDRHRLLVFAEPAELVHPVSGQPLEWTGMLDNWPQRAVLAQSAPESSPGRLLESLGLAVVPATLSGLDQLARRWQEEQAGPLRWENAESLPPIRLPRDASSVDLVRLVLPGAVFDWLCCAAAYPDLDWELLLFLSGVPELPADVASERNLRLLLRLEWLRDGEIPRPVRERLVQAMPPALAQAARRRIVQALERAQPPPSGSHAALSRELQIAMHSGISQQPGTDKPKTILKKLRGLPLEEIGGDALLVRFLEREDPSAGAEQAPEGTGPLLPPHLRPDWVVRTFALAAPLAVTLSLAGLTTSDDARYFFTAALCALPLGFSYGARRLGSAWRARGNLAELHRSYRGYLPVFFFPKKVRLGRITLFQRFWSLVLAVVWFLQVPFVAAMAMVLGETRKEEVAGDPFWWIVVLCTLFTVLHVGHLTGLYREIFLRVKGVGDEWNEIARRLLRWPGFPAFASAATAVILLGFALPQEPALREASRTPDWLAPRSGSLLVTASTPLPEGTYLGFRPIEEDYFFFLKAPVSGSGVRIEDIYTGEDPAGVNFSGRFGRGDGAYFGPLVDFRLGPGQTARVEYQEDQVEQRTADPQTTEPAPLEAPQRERSASARNAGAVPAATPRQTPPNPSDQTPVQQAPVQQAPVQQQAPAPAESTPAQEPAGASPDILDLTPVPYPGPEGWPRLTPEQERDLNRTFSAAQAAMQRNPDYRLVIRVGASPEDGPADYLAGVTGKIAADVRNRFLEFAKGIAPRRVVASGSGASLSGRVIGFTLERPRAAN